MSETDRRERSYSNAADAAVRAALLRGDAADTIPRRPAGAELPLTAAQRVIWVPESLTPGTPLYNVLLGWELRGQLDEGALRAALDELVLRHEILRTRFTEDARGGVRQIVDPPHPLALKIEDVSAHPPAVAETRLEEIDRADARTPFEIGAAPPFRATLVRRAPDLHVLLMTLHHLLTDGWSNEVLEEELAQLYAHHAGLHDAPPPPPPPLQYGDYALWERHRLDSKSFESELGYWRERLDSSDTGAELVTDRPRPTKADVAGRLLTRVLSADDSRRVRDYARHAGATVFTAIVAAFHALVHRHSGATQPVVGTLVATRARPELERVVGLFLNPVCLVGELGDDPTAAELVARARVTLAGALSHAEVPFDHVVAALRPARTLNRNPLFQIMLDPIASTSSRVPWEPLEAQRIDRTHDAAKFDLAVYVTNEPQLRLDFEYRASLFSADTATHIADQAVTLLSAIVTEPDRRVRDLPLLEPAARLNLARACSGPPLTRAPRSCIHEVLFERAARDPHGTAVVGQGQQLSAAELVERAGAVTAALRSLGAAAERRVGVHLDRSWQVPIALFGVLGADAAYVPLDPSLPDQRLAFIAQDAGVEALVTSAGLIPRAGRIADVPVVDVESAHGNPDVSGWRSRPDQLAYVMYTSGSTGRPKGVLVEHRNVVSHFAALDRCLRDAPRHWQALSSYAFDASVMDMLWPICSGRSVEIPDDPIAAAQSGRGGATFMTPSLAKLMLGTERGRRTLGSFDLVLLGGETVPLPLARDLEAAVAGHVLLVYGPTEATCTSTWQAFDGSKIGIGRPHLGETTLVAAADGEPLPVGLPGELLLGGAGITRGYAGRPALTAKSFVPDPHGPPGSRRYRTGDLVRLTPDLALQHLGRIDNQVKVDGVRIELGELEAVAREHPGVADAAAVMADTEGIDRALSCFVVLEGGRLEPRELRTFLAERLPRAMVPARIATVERLPLLLSGKVDRSALAATAAPAVEGSSPPSLADDGPPREREVARAWSAVLGHRSFGRDDNFFDVGGSSMLMLNVLADLRQSGYDDLALVDLYRMPTVRGLAAHLNGTAPPAAGVRTAAHARAHARSQTLTAQRQRRRTQ